MFEYAMLYHGQTGQAIQVSQGDTALKEIPDFPPGKVNAIPDFPPDITDFPPGITDFPPGQWQGQCNC